MTPFEIIYVDDDLEDLDLFAEAVNNLVENKLANIGLTVYKSGETIISTLRDSRFENCILFLDINMPGKNGLQILEEIRRDNALLHFPVLMYSTSVDSKSIDTCYQLGANAYLVKPDNFRELENLIAKVISIDWKRERPGAVNFVLNPPGKRI